MTTIEHYDTELMKKGMSDLNLTLMSMSEDEIEIFKGNNKELIDSLINTLIHIERNKLTPKKKKERELAVYDMCSSLDNHSEEARFWAERFYDAGYRKPQ